MKRYAKANIAWSISILSVLLVVAITWRIPLPSHGADMIGFAATVTSMALAVFAIFQSMRYASDASREKREAAVSSETARVILDELRRQIPEIGNQIRQLGEKVDQFGSRGAEFSPPKTSGPEAEDFKVEDLKVILANASPAGLLAIEAVILSFETKKPILLNFDDHDLNFHTLGYIGALSATRFLEYTYNGDTVVEIPQLNHVIANSRELVAAAIEETAKKLVPESSIIPARKHMLAYFGGQQVQKAATRPASPDESDDSTPAPGKGAE